MYYIRRHTPLPLLFLALVLSIAACTGDEVENPQIAAEKTQLYANIEETLDSVNRRLAELEAETADTLPPQVQTQFDRLRQIESALQHRLEQVNSVTEGQWQKFRTDAERLMRETRTALAPDSLSDTLSDTIQADILRR